MVTLRVIPPIVPESGDVEQSLLSVMLEELHALLAQGTPRATVEMVVDFIERYSDRQFVDEEYQIATARYPWARDHCRQHEAFRRRLRVLRVHLIVETPTSLLANMVKESLVDWCESHETGADRRLAAHLQAVAKNN